VEPLAELSSDELDAVEGVELDVIAGVELAELTLAVCLLSAGSCPVTSISAMNSHAVTNSAAAPEITRLRIVRVRPARASRASRARSRAAARS